MGSCPHNRFVGRQAARTSGECGAGTIRPHRTFISSKNLQQVHLTQIHTVLWHWEKATAKIVSSKENKVQFYPAGSLQCRGELVSPQVLNYRKRKSFLLRVGLKHVSKRLCFDVNNIIRIARHTAQGSIQGQCSKTLNKAQAARECIHVITTPGLCLLVHGIPITACPLHS